MRTALAVLLLGLAACSDKKDPAPAPAPAAPTAPSVPLKAMKEREPGAPTLSLSVNGSIRPVLTRGWPAWATADVDPPGAKIAIEGAWGWSESPAGWSLTAERTAAIPAGKHRLAASAGTARVELEVEVRDEPVPLPPAELEEKRRLQAMSLRSASRWPELLALAKESGSAEWEGDALLGQGKKAEAATAYARALDEFRKANPKAKEPPALLRAKLAQARGF